MREYLIVDGYNIIYAWPLFARYLESGIEHARSKLTALLADYASVRGQKVVVVFDAYKQKGASERTELVNGVEVVYTKEGETADARIERLVGTLMARQALVRVATSDWAEQGIVFGQGAYRVTPGELLTEINEVKETSKKLWTTASPFDNYLESRLNNATVRLRLERWRKGKP